MNPPVVVFVSTEDDDDDNPHVEGTIRPPREVALWLIVTENPEPNSERNPVTEVATKMIVCEIFIVLCVSALQRCTGVVSEENLMLLLQVFCSLSVRSDARRIVTYCFGRNDACSAASAGHAIPTGDITVHRTTQSYIQKCAVERFELLQHTENRAANSNRM